MGEVGKDLELGAVGGGGGRRLGNREGPVGATRQHQHRQLRYRRRVGAVEEHHVQVGEVGLVLEPFLVVAHLALAHRLREEHLARQLRRLDDRPEAQQRVGLEELQRVPGREAQRGHQHAAGRHRGEQHCAGGGMLLQVLLDDEAAHRMADDDGWRLEGGRGGGHVLHVVGDPGPAQPPVAAGAVGAEVERPDRPAAVGEVAQEVLLPAPGAVPGAMHEQQRRPQRRAVSATHLPAR